MSEFTSDRLRPADDPKQVEFIDCSDGNYEAVEEGFTKYHDIETEEQQLTVGEEVYYRTKYGSDINKGRIASIYHDPYGFPGGKYERSKNDEGYATFVGRVKLTIEDMDGNYVRTVEGFDADYVINPEEAEV